MDRAAAFKGGLNRTLERHSRHGNKESPGDAGRREQGWGVVTSLASLNVLGAVLRWRRVFDDFSGCVSSTHKHDLVCSCAGNPALSMLSPRPPIIRSPYLQ